LARARCCFFDGALRFACRCEDDGIEEVSVERNKESTSATRGERKKAHLVLHKLLVHAFCAGVLVVVWLVDAVAMNLVCIVLVRVVPALVADALLLLS